MKFFKSETFDSVICAGTVLTGTICIPAGSVIVIDGELRSKSILVAEQEFNGIADAPKETKTAKKLAKTKMIVNGKVGPDENELIIKLQNVTVGESGVLICKELHVEGELTLNSNAKIVADLIRYRTLSVESDAVILARLEHLDHVSAGEIV